MNAPLPYLPEEELEEVESSSKKSPGFRPYVRTFLRKAWLIAGITSLTTFAGWMVSANDPYTYTGSFYLLVEPITSSAKLTNPTTLARTGGVPDEALFELDYPTNLVFLTSPGMTFQIAQDVHKKQLNRPVPAIWKDLRDNLKVNRASLGENARRGSETKIFAVSYTGENPQEVQEILATAADIFVKYSGEDRETNIKAGVKFIDNQLPNLQERLATLKSRQEKLRQQYELIDPLTKNSEVLTQVSGLKEQIFSLDTQFKSLQTLASSLQKQLNLSPDEAFAASTLSQDPDRLALMAQIQEIDRQIAVNSATFTNKSYQVQSLQDQKQNLLELLNQKTQAIITKKSLVIAPNSAALEYQEPTRLQMIQQLVETTNQIKVIENQRKPLIEAQQQLERQSKRYPKLINEYSDVQRQIQLTEELLNKLLLQRETLKVESAQDLPWQLISKPQIPLDEDGKPIGEPPSRKKKIAAGVGGGLFIGMAAAIIWEKRRNIFFSSEDIPDILSIPLMVNIPKDDRSQIVEAIALESNASKETPELEATHQKEPLNSDALDEFYESPFLLAFDDIYAKLSLLPSKTIRSLLITSVESKDGQSTVAMNLAISAATAGQRVLLVDVNWHKPQLHSLLEVSNDAGLCQVINEDISPKEVIQSVPNTENLFILTTGKATPHPPKRLWSARMQYLIEELPMLYDLVIYDVPHFFDNPDIKFLGSKMDGILMVVTVQKTAQSLAKKAIKDIETLNLPILGAVANNII